MKLQTSTLALIVACSTAVSAAPTNVETSVQKRADNSAEAELTEALRELQSFNKKRDVLTTHLDKRQYEIVTKVLSSLNDTGLAPKVIHYLATSLTLQPIVIKTLVAVIKAGAMNLTALFDALDQSNLIVTVLDQLISDCNLYVSLFNTAKKIIADLEEKVEALIKSGVSKLTQRELRIKEYEKRASQIESFDAELEKRDLEDIAVNLLESLGQSGLASSVVESILTDSSYIPFATELVKEVIASGALSLSSLITALKDSHLVGDLLKQILNVDTFKTVATTAFAAFFGDCPSASSVISASAGTSTSSTSGSDSGSSYGSGSSSTTANPCKKRRRRRRRSYDY